MNWIVVLIFAYVTLGLELAVKPALALGEVAVGPSFVVAFIVFLGMHGPTIPVLWTAFLMGAIVDLATPRGSTGLSVFGPYALGYLCGTMLVLNMRSLMIRKNPLSVAVLAFLAGLFAELIVVTLMTVRGFYVPELEWRAGAELVRRLFSSLYTGGVAFIVGALLLPFVPMFRFQDTRSRRY